MQFLVCDDEPRALGDLREVLVQTEPDCEVQAFLNPVQALEYGRENHVDVAFLDIEMGRFSGLALAKELKDAQPYMHTIFVTGYKQYAVEAFTVRATGYLLKPAQPRDVLRELEHIRSLGARAEVMPAMPGKVRVKTFGGFDVFVDNKPLIFKRAKAKELLAYLVDRRGNSVTTGEACGILFEDEVYDENRGGYMRTLVSVLRKTLADAGISDILIRTRNSLSVDPGRLDCDAYRFMDGDPYAVNNYHSDYMINYEWAVFSAGLYESDL